MGGSYVGSAGVFLIKTLFDIYILMVMLRFLLQWVRADFYNPLSQFLVKVTNPTLVPLRRIIPGLGGVDLATVVLLLLLQVTELVLIGLVSGVSLQPLGLLVMSIADLMSLLLNVFFFSILIQVIISWINPGSFSPVIALLHSLNEPLLRQARRMIPPISGMDFSPIAIMIGLQLLTILLVAPISDIGRGLL